MATVQRDEIGVLNIELNQGGNKPIFLVFNQKNVEGATVPVNLTDYDLIRLDVKSRKDVMEAPFISWQVGEGLTISGENSNVLNFEFSQEFIRTAAPSWYYDIKFVRSERVSRFIEGQITIKQVTTK